MARKSREGTTTGTTGPPRRQFGVVTSRGKLVRQGALDAFSAKKSAPGRPDSEESGQVPKGEHLFRGQYGPEGLVEPPYDLEVLAELPDMNTWHKRCTNTKAQDVAGLGYEIVPLVEGDEPDEEDKAKLEAFYRDLSTPISATIRNMLIDLDTFGFAAIEMVRQDRDPNGDPQELYHLQADTVRVHKRGDRYQQRKGRMKKWFRDVDYAEVPIDSRTGQARGEEPARYRRGRGRPRKEERALPATEVMWFRHYTHKSEHYGSPPVLPALSAIYGDQAQARFNTAFFDNYGMPAWAVFITGDYDEGGPADPADPDGPTVLEAQIEEQFQSFAEEPHSIMTVFVPSNKGEGTKEAPGGVEVEFVKLDVEVKDSSFRMYRLDNRDEVIQAHGVPKGRIGIREEGQLAGSSSREDTEIYKTSVLKPLAEAVDSVFTRYVHQGGFGIEGWAFRLKMLDTRDEKRDEEVAEKRVNRITLLVEKGLMTPNDAREELGYKRIEPGDPAYHEDLDRLRAAPLSGRTRARDADVWREDAPDTGREEPMEREEIDKKKENLGAGGRRDGF